MFYRLLIGLSALAFGTVSFAADSYKCTVEDVSQLDDVGELTKTAWMQVYKGKEFVVDVSTGRMIGGITNANAAGQPQVLDSGSEEQSLKVITIFGPNVAVDYLLVRVFQEGAQKPFIFVTGEAVLSGTCIEY